MFALLDDAWELVRLQVAERFGWRSIEYANDGYLVGMAPGRKIFETIPSYARDIKAAWMILDYLSMHGVRATVQTGSAGEDRKTCIVELEYKGKALSRTQAVTVPLGICHAFLQIPGERLACSFSAKSVEKRKVLLA